MIDLILNYYKNIDENNIQEALKIFSNNAIYKRGNNLILNLKKFYQKNRIIKSGKHFLKKIEESKDKIVIYGDFEGLSKRNIQLKTSFKDTFFFETKKNLVFKRITHFYGKII